MSVNLCRWAWSLDLDTREKITLLALADCCNGHHGASTCWPSTALLRQMTGLSPATLKRALATLEARALISRELGGGRATTTYRLACTDSPNGRLDLDDPTLPESSRRGLNGSSQGAQSEPGGGSHGAPRGLTVSRQGAQSEPAGGSTRAPRGLNLSRQGAQSEPEGAHIEPRTGKEPEENPPGGTRERANDGAAREREDSLSGPPGGAIEWAQIASRARPDLPVTAHARAWEKFRAYHGDTRMSAQERAKSWRLWILRERDEHVDENHRERYTRVTRSDWGAFLGRPDSSDLSADYAVIRPETT